MKKTNQFPLNSINRVLLSAGGVLLSFNAFSASYGLRDVYQMALSFDAKIAQAKANYVADREQINIARSSLLPQLNAGGSRFITDSNNDVADNTATEYSLTLTQSIYDQANWSRYDQAKYLDESANLALKQAEQDLILRVAQSYFDVLLARKSLELSKDKEQADLTQYETAKASADLGLSSKVDVLEAKSNYDLSKSQTISTENQLDIAMETLANLTGKPLSSIKSHGLKEMLVNTPLPAMQGDVVKLEAKAETDNLAVLQAISALNQATEEISVKKSGHLPTVSFQAQYKDTDYSNIESGASFTDSTSRSYGVSLSMPLYSGGRTSSEVTASKQQSIAAQESLRDSKQTALLEVRTRIRNLKQGEKLVKALQEAVKSNDAFLESAEEGYRVGLKSMLEVLTARTNQTQAQKDLIEAVHNQVINKLKLEASIGDLTVDDILQFEALLQAPAV